MKIGWAGSWSWGTWWLGVGRWRLIVKAPWNRPLFSERNGYQKVHRLPFGWRWYTRMVDDLALRPLRRLP